MSDQDLKSRHRDRAPQLLADIGGTHTRLALADAGVLRPGSIRRYRNEGHATFEALLALYLRDCGVRECAGVCLAVAGPVRDGVVRMTNLGWELRREALRALTGSAEKSAGSVYGIELFGACVGAALASVAAAPILGIVACCVMAGVANFAAFGALLIGRRLS